MTPQQEQQLAAWIVDEHAAGRFRGGRCLIEACAAATAALGFRVWQTDYLTARTDRTVVERLGRLTEHAFAPARESEFPPDQPAHVVRPAIEVLRDGQTDRIELARVVISQACEIMATTVESLDFRGAKPPPAAMGARRIASAAMAKLLPDESPCGVARVLFATGVGSIEGWRSLLLRSRTSEELAQIQSLVDKHQPMRGVVRRTVGRPRRSAVLAGGAS